MNKLTIKANVQPSILGAVQGGTRVDLTYLPSGSEIELTVASPVNAQTKQGRQAASASPNPQTYSGSIVAGHDWALVRDDAVIMFDGTVTFTVSVGGTDVPIIMEVEGRIDLTSAYKDGEEPYTDQSSVLLAWKRGALDKWTLPVRLFLEFTVDQRTEVGKDLVCFERTTFFAAGSYTFGNPTAIINLTAIPAADASLPAAVPQPAAAAVQQKTAPKSQPTSHGAASAHEASQSGEHGKLPGAISSEPEIAKPVHHT